MPALILQGAGLQSKIFKITESRFPSANEPGFCAALLENGEPLLTFERGLADLRRRAPITRETNFRLASMTKQFTAAGVLLLRDAGKMKLESSLTQIFPDFPEYGAKITVRHILNHTSGLIAYESLLHPDRKDPILDAEILELMMQQEGTYFAPGEQFRYSNSGYAVLAMIIEQFSGQRFAEFLKSKIFEPLGMSNAIVFENGRSVVRNRAYGFRADNGRLEFADQNVTTSVLGDGGIYCSVIDYAKWDKALLEGSLLSPDTIREAFTPGLLNDGSEIPYGFGWRLREANGRKVVYHTGSTSGFNTCVSRIPEMRQTFVILANRTGTESHEIAREWELAATESKS